MSFPNQKNAEVSRVDVRDWLNRNRNSLIAASTAVLLAAAVFCYSELSHVGRAPLPVIPTRAFYTSDDGATLFADSLDQIPPFDHGGQPAVKAYVFECSRGGNHWVQYLEKMTDDGAKKMAGLRGKPSGSVIGPTNDSWLVKQPGRGSWVKRSDPAALKITWPQCPDGCDPASIREVAPQ